MTGEAVTYRHRFSGYGIRDSNGDIVGYCTNKEKAKEFCTQHKFGEEQIVMLYECVKC